MVTKQEFVLQASKEAILSLITSRKEFDNSLTSEGLFDVLINQFGILYDKCAEIKKN
jgi:hypothetical protein